MTSTIYDIISRKDAQAFIAAVKVDTNKALLDLKSKVCKIKTDNESDSAKKEFLVAALTAFSTIGPFAQPTEESSTEPYSYAVSDAYNEFMCEIYSACNDKINEE